MKDIPKAMVGVLVFIGMQRFVEIVSNLFIKPNIPNQMDPQEKDAIQLFVEVITIVVLVFLIKKIC
jgi:hypothetical protein